MLDIVLYVYGMMYASKYNPEKVKTYRCYCSTCKKPFKSFSKLLLSVKCLSFLKGSNVSKMLKCIEHAYTILRDPQEGQTRNPFWFYVELFFSSMIVLVHFKTQQDYYRNP